MYEFVCRTPNPIRVQSHVGVSIFFFLFAYSLVNSIVEGRGLPTVGPPAKVSTVGIELHRHNLKGTTVELYDCAGQVDYYGMHQTFLTRRALYLLVWDVSRCHGKTDDDLDEVGKV